MSVSATNEEVYPLFVCAIPGRWIAEAGLVNYPNYATQFTREVTGIEPFD